MWTDLARVFEYHNNNTDECVPWLLELIGQIQAKIADRCDIPVISYLFDILIFAVVFFSGNFVFLTEGNEYNEAELKDCFPQSLATLLDRNYWETCSVQVGILLICSKFSWTIIGRSKCYSPGYVCLKTRKTEIMISMKNWCL